MHSLDSLETINRRAEREAFNRWLDKTGQRALYLALLTAQKVIADALTRFVPHGESAPYLQAKDILQAQLDEIVVNWRALR